VTIAALGLVSALAWALRPMETASGFACDGLGGAIRWQAGAGASARAAALQRQTDMSRALSALAHDRAVQGTALGGEATDDANDARNHALHSLPQIDHCDALARSRLAWSLPVGLLVVAGGAGLVWLSAHAATTLRRRPRPATAGPPPACPLCGETLGVDGLCAACSGFEAGHTGDWRTRLPDAPPQVGHHTDS
jgi:hypothetical protein